MLPSRSTAVAHVPAPGTGSKIGSPRSRSLPERGGLIAAVGLRVFGADIARLDPIERLAVVSLSPYRDWV